MNFHNIIHCIKKIIVITSCIIIAGCSTIPYPELPGLRVLTGQILTKEEQQKVMTDMRREREQHQDVKKETVSDTSSEQTASQGTIQPAVIQ